MTFNWSGKDGQPTWLWGGEDGTNMYVYNPGNFKVNWAQSAANGVYANGFDGSGGGYIRFCNGAQICWGRTNCSGKDTTINFSAAFSNSSYSVSTMPFYSSLANTYWNVKKALWEQLVLFFMVQKVLLTFVLCFGLLLENGTDYIFNAYNQCYLFKYI